MRILLFFNIIGLGMSIAASIIEEHHGKISARNNPGSGATLTIEIPVNDL